MPNTCTPTTPTTSAVSATHAELNPFQEPLTDKDVEKGENEPLGSHDDRGGVHKSSKESSKESKDPNLVTWDGPDDPEFPKNWPDRLKWKVTWAVSMFVFISPVSSAMIAPALQDLAAGLDMHSRVETSLSLALFILAYAVGPVLFGPASELYGRARLLQASSAWYVAWNLGCSFARTKGQFFAFRFLAGIGGSAPLALGGGFVRYAYTKREQYTTYIN